MKTYVICMMGAILLVGLTEVLNATVQNAVNTLSEVLIRSKGKIAKPIEQI
jgi:diacylglycerol kinase